MDLQDLIRGLMFQQQQPDAPPPLPPLANASFGDRFAAATPPPTPMVDATAPVKDQSRIAPAPAPLQGPPAPQGGMFGGLPGWDGGERPMGNPPPMQYAGGSPPGPPQDSSDLPEPISNPRGLRIPLSSAGGGGGPAAPPPSALPPGGPSGGPGINGGGLLGALGLSPQRAQMLLSGIGNGLQSVPNVGGGGAFVNGLGGALRGTTKSAEDDRSSSLKEKTQEDLNDYRNSSLGETANYHKGLLERGNYDLVPGTQNDENGNPVSGTFKFDRRTGQQEFTAGQTVTSKSGRGASDSVYQQKLKVGNAIYGEGTKEAADYAAGHRTIGDAEAMKFGMGQAEGEIRNDPKLQRQFKTPEDRQAWKNRRAREIAGQVRSMDNEGRAGGATRAPSGNFPAPASKQEYDALPPGAQYQHPDDPPGTYRTKRGKKGAGVAPLEEDNGPT